MSGPDRLAAIRERLAKATPGPWYNECSPCQECKRVSGAWTCHGDPIGRSVGSLLCFFADEGEPRVWAHDTDGEFIAHAPADLAYLLAEMDRLWAEAVRARDLASRVMVLEAEVARLRAVLRQIASWGEGAIVPDALHAAVAARRAVAAPTEGGTHRE